jgi:ketosteroid isomerase-like protein
VSLSQDSEMRDVCNRFLDAIEAQDMDAIGDLLSPDLKFWANFTNTTKGRDDMLQAISAGYALHRHRHYNDRQIRALDGGFLIQYTCAITRHDGSTSAHWAGMVADVRDGRIVRVDEYMDSGKFAPRAAG